MITTYLWIYWNYIFLSFVLSKLEIYDLDHFYIGYNQIYTEIIKSNKVLIKTITNQP